MGDGTAMQDVIVAVRADLGDSRDAWARLHSPPGAVPVI